MSETILSLHEVSYRHPGSGRGLDRLTIGFEPGKRAALLGLNGAGKTTLLLHLNGILRPDSGEVHYWKIPMDYRRVGLRELRSCVGLVFQNPDVQIFSASVREDVSFGPMNLGLDQATVRQRVEESIRAVGLEDCVDRPVHALSHGQKKRLCIAGVLAMKPEVLLLDEPMAGLDVSMQAEFTTLLAKLHAGCMTIIVSTHDLSFAYQWADTRHVLAEGRCVASWDATALVGSLDELVRLGLGTPGVAVMHRRLVEAGVLPIGETPPRSQEALSARLGLLKK